MGSDSGKSKDGPSLASNFAEDLGNLLSGTSTGPHSAYDKRNAEAMANKKGGEVKDYLPGGKYGPGGGSYSPSELHKAGVENQKGASEKSNDQNDQGASDSNDPERMRRAGLSLVESAKKSETLGGGVGPNGLNAPADVSTVQKALVTEGELDEETGYIGTKMLDATKTLQEANGLKVDGQINSGGPTEASLFGGQAKTPSSQPQTQSGAAFYDKQKANLDAAYAVQEKNKREAENRQRMAEITKVKQRTNYAAEWQKELTKPKAQWKSPQSFAVDYQKSYGITSGYAPVGAKSMNPVRGSGDNVVSHPAPNEPSIQELYNSVIDGLVANGGIEAKNGAAVSTKSILSTSTYEQIAQAIEEQRQNLLHTHQYSVSGNPRNLLDEAYYDLTSWHFEDRDLLNSPLPSNEDEAKKMDFERYPEWQAKAHQNSYGKPEVKYAHPDGREVIFDGDTGQVVTTPQHKGSFNYYTPPPMTEKNQTVSGWADFITDGILKHGTLDVVPYAIGGNVRGRH